MASDVHLIVLALTRRRLVTNSRGYIGMTPEEALKDDIIAVLCGCNFPVVIYPCGDRYYFFGECYVDGVMNGEFMEAKDRGENQERDHILLKPLSHQYRATELNIRETWSNICRESWQ
jgi:hypothetical protein